LTTGPIDVQLTIDDELVRVPVTRLEAGERFKVGELERLGDSDTFVDVLVEVLRRNGWEVGETRAFAGENVLFRADCGMFEAGGEGPTRASALGALLEQITTYYGVAQIRSG
jgi:hypothetical protein